MRKQKIGFSLGYDFGIPTTELIKLLKDIGFSAVSPAFESEEKLYDIVTAAKECGMVIQSLHAPFYMEDCIWSNDPDKFTRPLKELLASLEACKKFGIPVMVAHTWIGLEYTFSGENLYFGNFDTVVKKAQEYGVKIAFENTEGEEYLEALMERYKDNETVGFCWDSGHEMCYNRSKDMLGKFGNRLLMTHLNDNLGIVLPAGNDLHFLPYDGVADWDYNIKRLKESKAVEILNCELRIISDPNRPDIDLYSKMTTREYLEEAYKRVEKIADKYFK